MGHYYETPESTATVELGVTFICTECTGHKCTLTIEAPYVKRFDSDREDCSRPECPFTGKGDFKSEAELKEMDAV